MTWVRIESGFLRHRKVLDLPINAKMLFIGGLCYSAENGTDGFITKSALRVLTAELDVKATAAAHLVNAGLWHKQADGWDIHDYLVYQPSAEQERQRRQETTDRVKAWRETKKARRNAVGNSVTTPVTNAVTNPVRNAPGNGLVTLSPNPNPNPLDTSSSSEPFVPETWDEEDEGPHTDEARRRLLTTTSHVTDPVAWVRATARRLEAEGWTPPTTAPAADCRTCNDLPLEDGCPDCTRSATA